MVHLHLAHSRLVTIDRLKVYFAAGRRCNNRKQPCPPANWQLITEYITRRFHVLNRCKCSGENLFVQVRSLAGKRPQGDYGSPMRAIAIV